MKNRKNIIIGVVVLVVVVVAVWFAFRGDSGVGGGDQEVSMDEPINIVLNFSESWLAALQSADTDPYKLGLANNPLLSKELREKLKDAKSRPEGTIDPVICSDSVPTQVAARPIFEREDKAQVLVFPRDAHTRQAVVTLNMFNNGWYIADIECSLAETAPDREFTFEREGSLLKGSLPAPFDSQYWHLVFEEDDVQGNVVPLYFDTDSQCRGSDDKASVCDTGNFSEAQRVFVQGSLSETGVEVQHLKTLK